MSAYTAIRVTRKTALELYLKAYPTLTDERLEKFLEQHLDKYLYNVMIVNDDYYFSNYETNGDEIARSHLE